ncbi:MAG: pyrroline-5-carboxylate reductase [Spirochaetales bacterium]|jgi:pyrroline-5-carboxylate reductase|nr:pyrroline-5-carboxylate reductase [Spirochaetales bacterium]
MKNIGIIGFGNMGEAFAAGLRNKFGSANFGVVEKVAARMEVAVGSYAARDFTGDFRGLLDFADVTIIAVKPQDAALVVRELGPYSKGRKFVAIVAGKPLAFYREYLKTPYLARCMPNIAAMYQKAAVGVCFPGAQGDVRKFEVFRGEVLDLVSAAGEAWEIPEGLMPVITGLSGSGIAYVFAFVHALAMGGVKAGLGYERSRDVAVRVLEGAAAVLRGTKDSPANLIAKVCSPAGTTVAGIEVLEEAAFTAAVMRAVGEAASRAEQMEGVQND